MGGHAWTWKTRLTIRRVLWNLIQENGFTAIYRGMGPTLLGIVPYAGVKFYVYQSLKDLYIRKWHPKADHLPIPVMLAFGGIAGLLGQTVSYPLDVVRRRMQVPDYSSGFDPHHAQSPQRIYHSTWDAMQKLFKHGGGYRALFRGMSINYIKVIPSTAIGFTTYDFLMSTFNLDYHL